VDIFCEDDKKTGMITLLLLGVPLGVISGYIMTALLVLNFDVISFKF